MSIKSKGIEPLDIAKWFINWVDRQSGDDITHLKLQKLLYYAQAWMLANRNESLFDEDMQAWTHGPVVPSVWRYYSDYKWKALPPVGGFYFAHKEIEPFLSAVFDEYGEYSAKRLERMTHEEAPWKKTRGNLPIEAACSRPIDKELIRDYYAARIQKQWQ